MKSQCSGYDVPDVTLQKEKENYKFTDISEEINAWNTFWNINKLTILCSEKPFNSYYTETSQMICSAKHLAGFQTVHIFSEKSFQTDINPFSANVPFKQTRYSIWFLLAKYLKKHLWKSDILSKDPGHWPISLYKMSLYHRCFLAYLPVKTNYLVSYSCV